MNWLQDETALHSNQHNVFVCYGGSMQIGVAQLGQADT